ncbi:hypothetical protein BJV74DRAFT_779414 [Russula compacta]|nr:hypothetical protein BJV74DRAFT_779414 [Russula compacta]
MYSNIGTPCDEEGNTILPNTPPPPQNYEPADNWAPFESHIKSEFANFAFCRNQMSAGHIDELLNLWAVSLFQHGDHPLFADHNDMYATIDAIPHGDIPWQSFLTSYKGVRPDKQEDVPSWMDGQYDVWFRDPHLLVQNLLSNPDFDGEFDYILYKEYDPNNDHWFQNFFSGDWVWEQADEIAKDPATHGSTFVLIILGSDKTTVSIATSDNEYYPLYALIGNIHNNVRHAHHNGVVLVGFLAIPKTMKQYKDDAKFRKFRHQVLHSSLAQLLLTLKPGMTAPEVKHCPDGHFRHVIYGLGPYITDYPEQVFLSCCVSGWCPKCTVYSGDLDNIGGRCTREHTEFVMVDYWDAYAY